MADRKKVRITVEEWLHDLAAISSKNDEGLTVRELAHKMGTSSARIREGLMAAKARGLLRSGRRSTNRIDGVSCLVPVYRIEHQKKK